MVGQGRKFSFFILFSLFISSISVAGDKYDVSTLNYKYGNNVIISAHRAGATKGIAENSMAALKRSVQLGFPMIEIDINMTKDRKLVLFHDVTLKRLIGMSGRLNNYTFDQIKTFKLKDFTLKETPETMPLFKDAMQYLKGKNILIQLDIKQKFNFDRVANLVEQYGMTDQVLFLAYKVETAIEWQKKRKWAAVSLPIYTMDHMQKAKTLGLNTKRAMAWVGTKSLNPQAVKAAHAMGMRVAFGTLGWRNTSWDKRISASGNPCEYLQFKEQGADIIATDKPAMVMSVLSGQYKCN